MFLESRLKVLSISEPSFLSLVSRDTVLPILQHFRKDYLSLTQIVNSKVVVAFKREKAVQVLKGFSAEELL